MYLRKVGKKLREKNNFCRCLEGHSLKSHRVKTSGSGTGTKSVSQRYKSADPDPYLNVTDLQHCFLLLIKTSAFFISFRWQPTASIPSKSSMRTSQGQGKKTLRAAMPCFIIRVQQRIPCLKSVIKIKNNLLRVYCCDPSIFFNWGTRRYLPSFLLLCVSFEQ